MKKHFLLMLLIIVLCLAVYVGALSHSWNSDDLRAAAGGGLAASPPWLQGAFLTECFARWGEKSCSPVAAFSYVVDRALWAQMPFGYHLTNILIHASSSVALYVLAFLLFGTGPLAFCSALLFAAHPVNSEAVNVVAFRRDLLAGLFLFWSFATLVAALRDDASSHFRKVCSVLAPVLFLLSLFCRETSIALLLILLPYRLLLTRNRQAISRFWRLWAAMVFVSTFYLLALPALLQVSDFAWQSSLAWAKAAVLCLRLLVLPVGLAPEHLVERWASPWDFQGWLSVVILGACLGGICVLRRRRRIVLAGLWVLMGIGTTVLLLSQGALVAQRYLYFSSAGLCLGLSLVAAEAAGARGWIRPRSVTVSLMAAVLVGTFAWKARAQTARWGDELALWTRVASRHPKSVRAHANLGTLYARAGDKRRAEIEFRRALDEDPAESEVHGALGRLLLGSGRVREALDHHLRTLSDSADSPEVWIDLAIALARAGRAENAETAVASAASFRALRPEEYVRVARAMLEGNLPASAAAMARRATAVDWHHVDALDVIGQAFLALGKVDAAVRYHIVAVGYRPSDPALLCNLGKAYAAAELPSLARKTYREASASDPNYWPALVRLSESYEQEGRDGEALNSLREAVEVAPRELAVYRALALFYSNRGMPAAAIEVSRDAVQVMPAEGGAHRLLGRFLMSDMNYSEAAQVFREAVSVGPDDYESHLALAEAQEAMGETSAAVASYREAASLGLPDEIRAHVLGKIGTPATGP